MKWLTSLLFRVGQGGARSQDKFEVFPASLPNHMLRAYYGEYLRFLQMPVIWVTILIYAILLIGICFYQSKSPHIILIFFSVLALGILTMMQLFGFWWLAERLGFRLQVVMLNILFGLLTTTLGWGTYDAWLSMPDIYIGAMTTIYGSILGAAAVILSYSRINYFVFLLGLMIPGIFFMLTHKGDFYLLMAILFTGGFVSFVIINIMEHAKTRGLFDARHQLSKERDKSEKLLLNILPAAIADELKEQGHAKPIRIEHATVMFTDFVGFTRISEKLTPEEVVDELDKCFSYFDQVTEKYGLEKLKTIGDSFMCAGGLPTANQTHAIDCCLAALEIQAFMNQMKDIKHQQGFDYWELRLGMNTGPLVAGVVGHKKFAYDVWGDTVNTASRLESSGVPGKINISLTTYEAVKHLFSCEHRGQVKAKNKGDIDMYFLNGIMPELSVDGAGRVPNKEFLDTYDALRSTQTSVV